MKFIAIAAAGLVAAASLTPVPAQAQRHGYGHDRGWQQGPGWRGDRRGWRGDRRHLRGDRRGWRGGRGWNGRRARTRCVVVRGYYGPQRQCYRVR